MVDLCLVPVCSVQHVVYSSGNDYMYGKWYNMDRVFGGLY